VGSPLCLSVDVGNTTNSYHVGAWFAHPEHVHLHVHLVPWISVVASEPLVGVVATALVVDHRWRYPSSKWKTTTSSVRRW
jgi:hypothetical protein